MAHHPPAIATTMFAMFAIFLFLSPPTTANSVVVDTDGNPLEVGSQYYVLPASPLMPRPGGLTFMPKDPETSCPTYVAQHWFWWRKGNPVRVIPANRLQKQVSEGDEVNIAFGLNVPCRNFGVWRVTLDNDTMISDVATDGRIFTTSESEFSASRFKIVKSLNAGYEIVYCFEPPKQSNINIMVGELKEKICFQLDALQPGPNGVSFLSLLINKIRPPLYGFIFEKVVPSTTVATTTY